jgi:hypothetical protein
MNIRHWFLTLWVLILAGCSSTDSRIATRLNESAALIGDLPANPLRWQIITSGVDPRSATMFTLFDNESAVRHARSSPTRDYPEGSVLALATWQQQEDSRWFGGKIPARAMSVEFIEMRTVANGLLFGVYRTYEGFPLKEVRTLKSLADQRTVYVLSLRAAVMP